MDNVCTLRSTILLIPSPCNGLSPPPHPLGTPYILKYAPYLSETSPLVGCPFLCHSMQRGIILLLEKKDLNLLPLIFTVFQISDWKVPLEKHIILQGIKVIQGTSVINYLS